MKKNNNSKHFHYVEFSYVLPSEDDIRNFAHSMGWTLEEYYDALDHGVPFEEEDAYIKKQRELKSSSN